MAINFACQVCTVKYQASVFLHWPHSFVAWSILKNLGQIFNSTVLTRSVNNPLIHNVEQFLGFTWLHMFMWGSKWVKQILDLCLFGCFKSFLVYLCRCVGHKAGLENVVRKQQFLIMVSKTCWHIFDFQIPHLNKMKNKTKQLDNGLYTLSWFPEN
jgi:hypothetical protein